MWNYLRTEFEKSDVAPDFVKSILTGNNCPHIDEILEATKDLAQVVSKEKAETDYQGKWVSTRKPLVD